MKLGLILGITAAVMFHVLVLLFAGLFFPNHKDGHRSVTEVELLDDTPDVKDKPLEELKPTEDEIAADVEQPPDAAKIVRALESPVSNDAPALEAASLSAIEAALDGRGGSGGDFADALSFASGGRIGGTGKAGPLGDSFDSAFSLAEIDQKPRAVFQVAPSYPAELRAKQIEGVVTLIFVVDATGKVVNPRVEKSTHPAFDKPALDAVRQWKFEPAVRGGQRVGCKMRAPIRFQPR